MYFARLLLILLLQLFAFSRTQDLQGSSITPPTTAFKSTTNIFEKFLTKSRASMENTTRSAGVFSTIVNATSEGLWFKTTSTSTAPTTKSSLVTILTTNSTMPTTTQISTETTTSTLAAITIPTTTEAKTSTTPITSTVATTIRTTRTLSTISSTKPTTSKKPKTIPTSTQSHAHHFGHHLSTSTIDSTVKSELTFVPNGCKNLKPHWAVSAVIFVALGSVHF